MDAANSRTVLFIHWPSATSAVEEVISPESYSAWISTDLKARAMALKTYFSQCAVSGNFSPFGLHYSRIRSPAALCRPIVSMRRHRRVILSCNYRKPPGFAERDSSFSGRSRSVCVLFRGPARFVRRCAVGGPGKSFTADLVLAAIASRSFRRIANARLKRALRCRTNRGRSLTRAGFAATAPVTIVPAGAMLTRACVISR